MLIRIDPSRDAALWEQVAASVRTAIAAGKIRSGERLPSAREVAGSLDLNLHTVLRAYQELRDEGRVMLVSTHNLGSVPEFCDRTVFVKGTVLAYGTTGSGKTHTMIGPRDK